MTGRASRAARWGAVGLLLAFSAVRWMALLRLPLFVDEAMGLHWTRDVLNGFTFQALPHARWLDTVIWALFRPLGPEAVWLARAVSVLASAVTCAAAITLGRTLFSDRAGLLAGALVIALPYAAFFDRQALAAPFLGAFGGLALAAGAALARRPDPARAAVFGAALAGATLSKFDGVLFAPAAALAALLLARPLTRRRALIGAAAGTALAGVILLGVLAAADRQLPPHDSILNPAYEWTWVHAGGDAAGAGATLRGYLAYFFGWPLTAAALASLALLAGPARWRRSAAWLWLAGIGPFVAFFLALDWLPARYLALSAMPFAVLAAASVDGLARLVPSVGRPADTARIAAAALALLLVVWPLPRTIQLTVRPAGAGLPSAEYTSYFDSVYSGYGLVEVQAALKDLAAGTGGPVHVIYCGVGPRFVRSYWGGSAGQTWPWDGTVGQTQIAARWLLAGETVVFLDTLDSPAGLYGTRVSEVGTYPGPVGRVYRLRRVERPGPRMLRVMDEEAFGHPADFPDDYAALVAALPPGDRALVAYPPHQADVLIGLTEGRGIEVIPVGEGWPLDAGAAARELAAVADAHRRVTAVFFNEQAGDPDHVVEGWLACHLYREAERWQGAVRAVDYSASTSDPALVPHRAEYGGMIRLDAAGADWVEAPGGDALIVRLAMHATAPVEASYTVGAYLFDGSGEVVAQHDGVPVGYLMPTTEWPVDERIEDRFAIALPPGLRDGEYTLCVALYDAGTMERLPLAEGGDLATVAAFGPDR